MTAKQLLLDTPLYTEVVIDQFSQIFHILEYASGPEFEGYNPLLKYDTTYKIDYSEFNEISDKSQNILFDQDFIFPLTLYCKRSHHEFLFYFRWSEKRKSITKVGQWPSLAEFHISQVKQYDKLLGKQDLKEFTRAIGLAANGVGIGSFVYLRRIFENLINESVGSMKDAGLFDEDLFRKLRMAERIDYLHSYLPEFLVAHKELYGILSLGIHELTEEDCLAHFDVVKSGIEFILDEKLEKYNRAKKMEAASARIKSTASTIKK